MLGDPAALSRGVLVERRAQLLAGLPSDVDLVVAFVVGDRAGQAGVLPLGEVLTAAAQDGPDPVQRVTGPATVAEALVLDPAPDLVHGVAAELTT